MVYHPILVSLLIFLTIVVFVRGRQDSRILCMCIGIFGMGMETGFSGCRMSKKISLCLCSSSSGILGVSRPPPLLHVPLGLVLRLSIGFS